MFPFENYFEGRIYWTCLICRRYKEKKSSMTVFWFEQLGGYWDHLLSWEYWNNWKFEEKSKVHFQSCYVKVMRRS